MIQNKNDPEPCRLKNLGGSERGTCDCETPKDCPEPSLFTPVGMMLNHIVDQSMAKFDEKKNQKL